MTSISTIPTEVLQQIFLYSCSGQRVFPPPKRLSSTYGVERTLSHVSREWRNLSIDTPRMWTRIVISWKGDGRGQVIPHPNRIDVYLTRSRNAPLDVHLRHLDSTLEDPSVGRRDTKFLKLVETLSNHSSRWNSLQIEVDNFLGASTCLTTMFVTSAPRLQILDLDFSSIPYRDAIRIPRLDPPTHSVHPSLTHVELRGLDLQRLPSPLPPLLALVVTLDAVSPLELIMALNLVPSLETLVLKRPEHNSVIFRQLDDIQRPVLHRLHTFVLVEFSPHFDGSLKLLCSSISTPNLRAFHFIGHREIQYIPAMRYLLSTPAASQEYSGIQTLDFRPVTYAEGNIRYHDDDSAICEKWINSLLNLTHLIIRSDILAPLLLHTNTKHAFPILNKITVFCNRESSSKHPKKCKAIVFVRKLMEFRLENQPFVPSQFKVRIFKRCSGGDSNRRDVERLKELAEVEECFYCPDELVGFDDLRAVRSRPRLPIS